MGSERFWQQLRAYGADVDLALERFLDDKEMYCECFELFVQDENFALLEQSLQAHDYGSAFNCVHTLKGVAANLGLTPAFACLSSLTESLRAHSYESLFSEYAAVEHQYRYLQLLSEALHGVQEEKDIL